MRDKTKHSDNIVQGLCFLNHETNKYSNQQLVKWDETTRTYTIRKLKTLSGRQKRLTNRELICECCRAVCIRIDFNILHFFRAGCAFAVASQWSRTTLLCVTNRNGRSPNQNTKWGHNSIDKLIEVERGESGRSTFESNRLTLCDWIWTRFVYKYRH